MSSRTVEIPEETYRALEAWLDRLGFDSVDQLAAHALRLLVEGDAPESSGLNEDEEAEMKQRLADLGYM